MSDAIKNKLEHALIENQPECTIFKVTTDVDGIIRTPNKVNSDVLDCQRVKQMDVDSLNKLRSILPSKSLSYLRVRNELKYRNLPAIVGGKYVHSNRGVDDAFSYLIPIIDVNAYEAVNDSDTVQMPH